MDTQKRTLCQHYRMRDICKRLNLSRSKIYLDISKGLFPPPIKLGRTSVWSEDQLTEYLSQMAKASR